MVCFSLFFFACPQQDHGISSPFSIALVALGKDHLDVGDEIVQHTTNVHNLSFTYAFQLHVHPSPFSFLNIVELHVGPPHLSFLRLFQEQVFHQHSNF